MNVNNYRFWSLLAFVVLALPGCVVVPLSDLFTEPPLREQIVREGVGEHADKKIAVIELRGLITASESRSLLRPHENTVSEMKARLVRAADDDDVRAVLLRIASPGGEVTACDTIHHEIVRFRQSTKKPVIACIQEQGASGAYYVALASDAILAHPTAVVGSIGVVLQSYDLSALLDKIGVAVAPIKSAEKKDLNSPFRRQTDEEREILQKLVDDMHERFMEVVASGRQAMSRDEIRELADGRVFSGIEAARLKLVDRTGYLEDAVEEAEKIAGLELPTIIRYTRRPASGGNVYTWTPVNPAARAEFSFRWQPDWAPGAKLMYLWQPGL